MLLFNFVETADTASYKHTVAISIASREINARLSNRFLSGNEGELAEAIDSTQLFAVDSQMRQWIEIADLTTKSDLEIAAVEPFYGTNATFSVTHRCPDVVQFAAKRSDNAKPGHHYSTA
jgi:hypothetical protein